jgi:hypothetical protein
MYDRTSRTRDAAQSQAHERGIVQLVSADELEQ